jgi:hypothetical protein
MDGLDGLSLLSMAVARPMIFCLPATAAATAENQEDAMTSHPLMLLDSRRRRHSSRSSASRRPPRSSRDHPELSDIGDIITSLLVADLTVPVADSSAHGPKGTRARDESPCSSRVES